MLKEKINEIHLGDCFNILKSINDNSIDLIATDPPYEIDYQNNLWDKEGSLDWEYLRDEFFRILKDTGSLVVFQGWSNVAKTKNILEKKLFLKNWIIYDRIKGRGAKTNLVSTREDILWFVKTDRNYVYNKISSNIKKKTGGSIGKKNGNAYRALSNVWTDVSPIVPWSKEREPHPTQKPLALMERIIKLFSNEDHIVLDPFCGCGTTCVASKKLHRNFIGIEKNEDFYNLVLKRLNNA